MIWYLVKLALLLPLIGLLIWGSLKLTQMMQGRLGAGAGPRNGSVRVVETVFLAPGQKLAVIEFRDRAILVAATRHGFTRLAESPLAEPLPSAPYGQSRMDGRNDRANGDEL